MEERDLFDERPDKKIASLNCPHCRQANEYELSWLVRTKKKQILPALTNATGPVSPKRAPTCCAVMTWWSVKIRAAASALKFQEYSRWFSPSNHAIYRPSYFFPRFRAVGWVGW